MKAINMIKRIVATGMGLTMVGATIFGASAAYSLSSFPEPFVHAGVPASNLAIVVGENAAATDVAGAVDLALALQAAAVTKVAVPGSKGGVTVQGDAVSIGSTSNLLNIDQVIGAVRETLTEVDLDMLKGGQIVTDQGSTEYNQYLKFPTTGASGKVKFAKDERDRVGHYLYWAADDEIFEWDLQFEQGLKSRIKNNQLSDLNDQDIMILGQPFVVVSTTATFDGVGNPSDFKMDMMGGAISAILGENDKETYTVDGKEYEVEVLVISETANSGKGSVKFRINGEITNELTAGDTDVLADGTQIGIRDIMATGKDIQKSIVQFYLGAYKLSFHETNLTAGSNVTAGATVNEASITKSTVQIKGRTLVTNETAEIDYIKYFLAADSVLGDVYVPPGSGVREQLNTPEGMLTPAWDIVYQGLTDTGTTNVVVDPKGNDEYNLQFTNQEGIFYDVPLLSDRVGVTTTGQVTGNCLKYGDSLDDLWFIEAANSSRYDITKRDFFVLSDCTPSTGKDTCFTHVLRYDSIDTTNDKLTFTDLGTGSRDVTFDNATRLAEVVVGGVIYNTYVDTQAPYNLSVDLTGDGSVNGDKAFIGIQGDGVIDLGANNSNETNTQGPLTCVGLPPGVNNSLGNNAALQATNLTLITLAKEFSAASSNENITLEVTGNRTTANTIGLKSLGLHNVTGTLFGLLTLTENEDLQQALSGYGAFFEEFVPTGGTEAESMTIEYPLSQRGAEVYVTGGAIKTTVSEAGMSDKINPIPTTVSMQDTDIDDVTKYNAIVVGGPCANKVANTLLGSPDPCYKDFTEGKALVKAFEHDNGNIAVLIAGFNAKDTRRATTAVAAGQLSSVQSTEAEVTGTSMSDIKVTDVGSSGSSASASTTASTPTGNSASTTTSTPTGNSASTTTSTGP